MSSTLAKLSFATLGITLGFTAVAVSPVQAVTFDFEVSITSGPLVDQTFLGSFSFDDSFLSGMDEEFIAVSDLQFSFNGTSFTESNGLFSPEVVFFEGDFLGLDFDAEAFNLDPGFDSLNEAFLFYDLTAAVGDEGDGDVFFTASTAVPEPTAVASLLALGIGVLFKASANRKN